MERLHEEIEHTTWCDATDLMGPFTNHLPQHNLITEVIVRLLYKVKDLKCLLWLINVS